MQLEDYTICRQGVKVTVERLRFEISLHERVEINEQEVIRELRLWIKEQKRALDELDKLSR
jgi:hypothetical protein